MDLDTLIYIIVMIIFLALGAFGKKKKPVQQDYEQEDPENGIVSMEDQISERLKEFLGDYNNEERIPPEKKDVLYKTEEPTFYSKEGSSYNKEGEPAIQESIIRESIPIEREYSKIADTDFFSQTQIHDSPIFQHFDFDQDSSMTEGDLTTIENQPELPGDSTLLLEEFQEGFDLRKAILYSEIMKHKYF